MRKILLLLFINCLSIKQSLGQFDFPADTSSYIIQQYYIDYIDTAYSFQKQNDFEFRFWIFPPSGGTKLLSFSNNNGKWKARYFYINAANTRKFRIEEAPVLQEGLDSLWNKLLEKGILTMPLAWTLLDKDGKFTIEQPGSKDVSYTLEFFSQTTHRSYSYTCPQKVSQRYDYIKEYKEVANMVKMILKYFGMSNNLICLNTKISSKS